MSLGSAEQMQSAHSHSSQDNMSGANLSGSGAAGMESHSSRERAFNGSSSFPGSVSQGPLYEPQVIMPVDSGSKFTPTSNS